MTEGVAPLTVQFDSATSHHVHWEFDDGTRSAEPKPSHTFATPGLYSVALTVTDADGARARNQLLIAVDRNSSEPIVRAGFARGETPALTLDGTAKRGAEGAVQLPDGAPWGRAEAGDGLIGDLVVSGPSPSWAG